MGDRGGSRSRQWRGGILSAVAVCFTATGLVGAGAASAAETVERGQALYENHCADCHKTIAHTRESRLVRNMGQLEQQVDRWQANQNLGWSAEDKAAVVQYLNRRFYKF